MEYYPVFLNLVGKRCLVVGGGAVAGRKVEGLLRAEAAITIISPALTRELELYATDKKIRHFMRKYRRGDAVGYQFVFAATGDREINEVVYDEAQENGALINAADDPEHCDFILPSVLRRGDLAVAVATGGSSPALSRAIREELEHYFTDDYRVLSEIVGEVRRELRARGVSAGREAWSRALIDDLRDLVQRGDIEGAKRYLRERVEA